MQLELCWRDAASIRAYLERATGLCLDVTLTDNRSSVISVRPGRNGARIGLRVHRMFLSADADTLSALAAWVKNRRCRKASQVLDRFIAGHRHVLDETPKRAPIVRTEGLHHDLARILGELNYAHFARRITAAITWGRMPGSKRRRSIRFGSYSYSENLIRIHPALDQKFVPEHFVRYIVFHEMLHADEGVGASANGRRTVHSRAFRAREREFPGYALAVEWQGHPENLQRLLSGPRRRSSFRLSA